MLKLTTNTKHREEKTYIFKVIFEEFFGLVFDITWSDDAINYEINYRNKQIIIEDHFFLKFSDGADYISEDNIPQNVQFSTNEFIPENNIPILFGTDKFLIKKDKILCGMDIFASCFFMLTRWEEVANSTLDKHERFPATASLAFKFNFLHRPIVNEYIEMLWNMLQFINFEGSRKLRTFNPVLSHDIDIPFANFTKNSYDDPCNTFDYLMDKSEELGIRSIFYIMDRGITDIDKRYFLNDEQIIWLINKIKTRDHIVGIHPSYATYNTANLLKQEIKNVNDAIGYKMELSRQHYLRFEVPTTWKLLDDAGIKSDSTLCYADADGFRCGCCYEYSVFDVLRKKHLNLIESPLIVMEGTLLDYIKIESNAEILRKLIYYIDIINKYNGNFILLVHNHSFYTYRNKVDMYKVYDEIIKYIKNCKLNKG